MAVDAELADDEELVPLGAVEVDEADGPAALAVGSFYADAFQQQTGGVLIDLDQLASGGPQQAVDGRSDTGVVEPLLAAVVAVDPPQGRREPVGEDHLAEAGPLGELGHFRVAVEGGPVERLEGLDQWRFDQGELVVGVHGQSRSKAMR